MLRTRSYKTVRPWVRAVGLLFEYLENSFELDLNEGGDLDLLISNFLAARLEMPRDAEPSAMAHWSPVAYDTVRGEFRGIASFASFCRSHREPTSSIGRAFSSDRNGHWRERQFTTNRRGFFAHLAAQRARWERLTGGGSEISPVLESYARHRSSTARRATTNLSIEEVNALIAAERNPVYRALWILFAYQGPRTSEVLNLWRCDVLPGSYSRMFADFDMSGLPLVVYADPRKSRYMGSFDRKHVYQDRERALQERWGLAPRPESAGEGQYAGWKGMLETDGFWSLSLGYWTDPAMGAEFGRLTEEITLIHEQARLDQRHPYFFVNARNAEHFGEPMKAGRVEEAMSAACRHVGIPVGTPGSTPHGLRHFYKWYAQEVLSLPDLAIQVMMRHTRVESQRDYGRRARDTHRSLSEAWTSIGSKS